MDGMSQAEQAQGMMQLQTLVQGQKATMKILGLCFDRCIAEPSDSLTYNDQQCVWQAP